MRARTSVAVAATVASALGSLALLPTYADLHWLPVTIGAVVVVGICAQGARLLGMPALLSPAFALAGLAALRDRGLLTATRSWAYFISERAQRSQ